MDAATGNRTMNSVFLALSTWRNSFFFHFSVFGKVKETFLWDFPALNINNWKKILFCTLWVYNLNLQLTKYFSTGEGHACCVMFDFPHSDMRRNGNTSADFSKFLDILSPFGALDSTALPLESSGCTEIYQFGLSLSKKYKFQFKLIFYLIHFTLPTLMCKHAPLFSLQWSNAQLSCLSVVFVTSTSRVDRPANIFTPPLLTEDFFLFIVPKQPN